MVHQSCLIKNKLKSKSFYSPIPWARSMARANCITPAWVSMYTSNDSNISSICSLVSGVSPACSLSSVVNVVIRTIPLQKMNHRRRRSLTAGSRYLIATGACCRRARGSLWESRTSSHWVGQSFCVLVRSFYILKFPIDLRLPYVLRIRSAVFMPNTLLRQP